MTFAETIRQARRDRGLTIEQLGAKISRDKTWMSKLENDRLPYPPTVDTITALANILALDRNRLLALSGRQVENDMKKLTKIFKKVYKTYPNLTTKLIEKIDKDPDFASQIFAQLKDS